MFKFKLYVSIIYLYNLKTINSLQNKAILDYQKMENIYKKAK